MAFRLIRRSYSRKIHELQKTGVPGLHVRRTTANDYDQVISLRKHLYDGLDYIPSEYHKMLKHNTGIAGFIGKTMVSFMFAAVIDDGRSVLIQSARVREEFEGSGILSQMKHFCFKDLPTGVHKMVFLTFSPTAKDLLQRKGAQVVFQRNETIFKTTGKVFRASSRLSDDTLSPLKIVDSKHLQTAFFSTQTIRLLFPENRIVVGRVPYQLKASNLSRIFNSGSTMLASRTNEDTDKCLKSPSLISASTVVSCESGKVVYLDLYGDKSNTKDVSSHIFKHLSVCLNISENNLVLYVTYASWQNTDEVIRIFCKYNWETAGSKSVYVFEDAI